jgi:hypothetical protein
MKHRTHLHIPASGPPGDATALPPRGTPLTKRLVVQGFLPMQPHPTLHIPAEGTPVSTTGLLLHRCPSCQTETLALAGSLCERCNPDSPPLEAR